jgi:hypothetical protein
MNYMNTQVTENQATQLFVLYSCLDCGTPFNLRQKAR